MWDYLGFPEKYRVNKKLGREVFLRNANLTDYERRYVQDFMLTANVLYDIVFSDKSEVVVLHSELKYIPRKKYFLQNYANAIAKSLPHKCLLILQCSGVAKIIVFHEHENPNDARRMVVDGYICSKEIIYCERSIIDKLLIAKLRECIDESTSADILVDAWYSTLNEAQKHNDFCLNEDSFNYVIERRNFLQKQDLVYERVLDGSSVAYNFNKGNSNLFEGVALNPDEVPYDKYFLDFCADLSIYLYEEVVENQIMGELDEKSWLDDYISACNDYAHDELNKVFDSDSVYYVRQQFYNHATLRNIEDYDEFDEEELKQYLYKYFYYDGDEDV